MNGGAEDWCTRTWPSSADAHSVSWSPKMVVNDAFVASIDRCVSGAIFRL